MGERSNDVVKELINETYEVPCIMCDGAGCSCCNDTGKITVIKETED